MCCSSFAIDSSIIYTKNEGHCFYLALDFIFCIVIVLDDGSVAFPLKSLLSPCKLVCMINVNQPHLPPAECFTITTVP